MPRLLVLFFLLTMIIVVYLNRSYAHIYQTIGQVNLPNPNQKWQYEINNGSNKIKYVALGDSLTAGVGVSNIQAAYPYLLALNLSQKPTSVSLIDLAYPGDTSLQVLQNQIPKAVAEKPDVVSLLIGVNDIHNLVTPGQFQKNLDQIITSLQPTHAKILLINTPYLGGPSLIKFPYNLLLDTRTNQFNKIIKNEAENFHLNPVDLYSKTPELKTTDTVYSHDHFHPNQKEYILWSKIIYGSYH